MTSVSHDNYSTAETYSGRSAPWSQEAEQAVLGAMLLDQDAAPRSAGLVDGSALKVHLLNSAAHMRLLVMGVILIVVLRFRPQGLIPGK